MEDAERVKGGHRLLNRAGVEQRGNRHPVHVVAGASLVAETQRARVKPCRRGRGSSQIQRRSRAGLLLGLALALGLSGSLVSSLARCGRRCGLTRPYTSPTARCPRPTGSRQRTLLGTVLGGGVNGLGATRVLPGCSVPQRCFSRLKKKKKRWEGEEFD